MLVFELVYLGGERSRSIVGRYVDESLKYVGPLVVIFRDMMYGYARSLLTGSYHGLMHAIAVHALAAEGSRAGCMLTMRPRYASVTSAGTNRRNPASTT